MQIKEKPPISLSELLSLPFSTEYPLGVQLFENTSLPDLNISPEQEIKISQELELRKKIISQISEYLDNSTSQEKHQQLLHDLTQFLNADQNHARLILYLPFEVLPKQLDEEINKKFLETYLISWISLLQENEARANFTNGDILEPGLGEAPNVCKALHLLPTLLTKSVILPSEILSLMEFSQDATYLSSLGEAILVAHANGLINESTYSQILTKSFEHPVLQKLFSTSPTSSVSTATDSEQSITSKVEDENTISLASLISNFKLQLAEIKQLYAPNSPYIQKYSAKRIVWEQKVKVADVTNLFAEDIAWLIISKQNSLTDIIQVLDSDAATTDLIVASLFIYADQLITQIDQPEKVAEIFPTLKKLWPSANDDQKNMLTSGLSHLWHLSAITDEELAFFDIDIPDLSKPFPVELTSLTKDHELQSSLLDALKNPEFSPYIEPIILLVGSRVKGYGDINSDTDLAIFFKPAAQLSQRDELITNLTTQVPWLNTTDQMIEFWLAADDNQLTLRPTSDTIRTMAGPQHIHFIFGGVWLGDQNRIEHIQSQLLKKYLDLARFEDKKDDVRRTLLRQLEIDVLQYRLLHKGYEKYYPLADQPALNQGELIDWNSTFWDSGYREVATKLFLSRVFLPDVSG